MHFLSYHYSHLDFLIVKGRREGNGEPATSRRGPMNLTMTHVRRALAAAALVALAAGGVALATAGTPKIEVSVLVEREIVKTAADGTQVVERKPVTAAHPGDVLVYTLTASNAGDGPALEARIEDPLPSGTELIVDSLEHGQAVATASLDGGTTWQEYPATVERTGVDGRVERVPAAPSAYTHLRWTLAGPLGPGESKDVRFKVRIR